MVPFYLWDLNSPICWISQLSLMISFHRWFDCFTKVIFTEVVMDWIVISSKCLCRSPTPKCDCIWTWVFKEVIKVKRYHEVRTLIQWYRYTYKKRKRFRSVCVQRKDHVRTKREGGQWSASQEEMPHQKPTLMAHRF